MTSLTEEAPVEEEGRSETHKVIGDVGDEVAGAVVLGRVMAVVVAVVMP
ncbi:MAG: hypothetical protein QWI73_06540 [Alphaproteobacteria bacterium]|nr:hypothetical protein [Alphaproteobacteria bacterium]